MIIEVSDSLPNQGTLVDWQLLTYAELGFSILKGYGDDIGADWRVLSEFEERVNETGKTGSLYPSIPIGAIPRSLIREECTQSSLEQHIIDFLRANNKHFDDRPFLFSFRDDVNAFVVDACKNALKSPYAKRIRSVVIFVENQG